MARLVVGDVAPVVDDGRYPGKAVVGEHVPVSATVWREGADAIAATVVWEGPGPTGERRTRMTLADPGLDLFTATIRPDEVGCWTFRVDAWDDPWTTLRAKVTAKLAAGQGTAELGNDFELIARLLDRADDHDLLSDAAARLRDEDLPVRDRASLALSAPVADLMWRFPVRELLTRGRTYELWVDRPRALAGAWYELFPRSTGGRDETGRPVHGTFRTALRELDRIAGMGFDVVYLPPVHPIGTVNRKGRNNSTHAGPEDVGSPWAIGSADGGHDAIHPDLGTIEDFDTFVARANRLGMEVAIDLALQCAPDHPWVREHRNWFRQLPDGTIAFAENPPKLYQDIYPLYFDDDPDGLLAEVERVVEHWIGHGIRIFRVDNPHTKPPDFWHRLIRAVRQRHPEILFLAEAFTRPARLYGLARLGFTQSYTYFTWRTTKAELTEFGAELAERAAELRPNLFVNTPDILPFHLQTGGRAMFALRAALAATLSPSWGVYSGFELFENTPLAEGREEYLDSEKFQLRPRDFAGALAAGDSLEPWLARLNEIRRDHPALRTLRGIAFHDVDNDSIIAYSKIDPDSRDTVLCVVVLDPDTPQEGTVRWDPGVLGFAENERFTVYDEVSGEIFEWGGGRDYVKLDPARAVAHIAVAIRA